MAREKTKTITSIGGQALVEGVLMRGPFKTAVAVRLPDGSISEEVLAKGIHYVDVALNEVPLFIRSGKCIPIAEAAECVKDIDTEHLQLIGYKNSSYTMYEDDGIHKDYDKEENYRVFTN